MTITAGDLFRKAEREHGHRFLRMGTGLNQLCVACGYVISYEAIKDRKVAACEYRDDPLAAAVYALHMRIWDLEKKAGIDSDYRYESEV
jgi:hypothetical protein